VGKSPWQLWQAIKAHKKLNIWLKNRLDDLNRHRHIQQSLHNWQIRQTLAEQANTILLLPATG